MGALLSLRNKDQFLTTDIIVDFENAKPSDQEKELAELVDEVTLRAPAILDQLRNYTGCGPAIAKAISKPSKETEDEAWEAVVPHVTILKDFFEFSVAIEDILPKLLHSLCAGDVMQNLEQRQYNVKQFADLLHFVLIFDDLKMTNPAIQNDFSYYRRTLSRMKMSDNRNALENLVVRDELANKMSLFYAYPTPMLNSVVTTTTNFVSSNSSIPPENMPESLAIMAAVCQNCVNNPERFTKPETMLYVMRVMCGVIILYDHIHPTGAFSKSSAINVKGAIKIIKEQGQGSTDGLLNALRYTTKHLNDEDTPKPIKQLLA